MASATRLYRLATALAVVGLLGAIVGLVVAVTNTTLALPTPGALAGACRQLLPAGASAVAVPVLGLAGLAVVVLVRAAASMWRRARAERRFRAALRPFGPVDIAGTPVEIVDHTEPRAFCAGYLRPRVHLSSGTLARLSEPELHAVVAHERHHVRRHDPLRLLIAGVLADALFFLPALRRLADRYGALAEIAADEAATRAAGASVLASALLAFNGSHETGTVVGIAPERVDHLLGEPPRWGLPASLFAGALVTLGGVAAAIASVLSFVGAPVDLATVLAQSCTLLTCTGGAAAAAGLLLLRRRA